MTHNLIMLNLTLLFGSSYPGYKLDAYGIATPASASKYKHQTTPLPQQPNQFVTITHAYHPWSGQSVKVIHVERGIDPDLLVQRPDGRHVKVAMSWTDYASLPGDNPRASSPPLLDVSGLLQIVDLIERIRQEKRMP
jgi:hypothetical protein